MTGECWWLRDATEPVHSLSASENLKLLLCFYLLSSRFIVVVGVGNKMLVSCEETERKVLGGNTVAFLSGDLLFAIFL